MKLSCMMLHSLSDPCALIVASLDCAIIYSTVLVKDLMACMGHDYKLRGGAVEKIIFSCVYFTLRRDILIVSFEKGWLFSYLFPYQCLCQRDAPQRDQLNTGT